MPARDEAMTKETFVKVLKKLGHTPYSSHDDLGLSLRQAMRYAAGDQPIPGPVAKLLDMYQRHGIPKAK